MSGGVTDTGGSVVLGGGLAPVPGRVRAPAYAAVDLGTNNCRLLVAQPHDDGFRVIDAYSRLVRLGAGVAQEGLLSEPAMRRTLTALRVCADKIERCGVTRARYVATEACRRAGNCDTFLDRVRTDVGIDLEIITAEEEARLALAACVPLLDPAQEYALVFDIGGGSTELIWTRVTAGAVPELVAWTSIPSGVVTLSEKHGGRDPGPEAYEAMVWEVEEQLEAFEDEHALSTVFAAGRAQMVGISGTITTVAAVRMGLARYDRNKVDGGWVSADDIGSVSRRLASMPYDERAAHPCIGKGRADLVVPGCAALEAILRKWPADRVRVADRGLREGILRQLIGTDPAVAYAPGSVRA